MEVKYLDNPDKWPTLANKLITAGEFGYDTETYNQPNKASPQHRAKIHCWSVGWLTSEQTNRGYRKAVGVVLPRVALDDPYIRAVFADHSIAKWAHNAPHDIHATRNEGIEINNCQDSLQWFRVAIPGLSNFGGKNYGLKSVEQWALGYPSRPDFSDMITYEAMVTSYKTNKVKGCVCGSSPCHQRSTKQFIDDMGNWVYHTRELKEKITEIEKVKEFKYDVTDFNPTANLQSLIWHGKSYNRWEEWLKYSLADAVHGIEAVDWLRNKDKPVIKYPWSLYGA